MLHADSCIHITLHLHSFYHLITSSPSVTLTHLHSCSAISYLDVGNVFLGDVQEALFFQRYNTFSFDLTNLTSEVQIYFWMIGSNFILRGSWTYKLSAHLRHNYLTVFTISLLEMLRRFQWIFFRVENEWNKMTRSGIQLTEIEKEEEKLLGSNIHDV